MQTIAPKEQIDFETNKRLLNRYRFIEYESLRILAGWLPATANMEFKLTMGRLLWEDAQHVQHLYQRLRDADSAGIEVLLCMLPEERGLGVAIADRLRRAAGQGGSSSEAT